MSTTLTNNPTIRVALRHAGQWSATYVRDDRYVGFGNSPTEAVGHLIQSYPRLFNVHRIFFSNDPATQTFVQTNGLDTVLTP